MDKNISICLRKKIFIIQFKRSVNRISKTQDFIISFQHQGLTLLFKSDINFCFDLKISNFLILYL